MADLVRTLRCRRIVEGRTTYSIAFKTTLADSVVIRMYKRIDPPIMPEAVINSAYDSGCNRLPDVRTMLHFLPKRGISIAAAAIAEPMIPGV